MGLRFVCPSTGHKIETALGVEDEKLLLFRQDDLQTPCSFCGGSHEWVFARTGATPRAKDHAA